RRTGLSTCSQGPARDGEMKAEKIHAIPAVRACRPHQLPRNGRIVAEDLNVLEAPLGVLVVGRVVGRVVHQLPEESFESLRGEAVIELVAKAGEIVGGMLWSAGPAVACLEAARADRHLRVMGLNPGVKGVGIGNVGLDGRGMRREENDS